MKILFAIGVLVIATITVIAVKSNHSDLIHCGPPKESGMTRYISEVVQLWAHEHNGQYPKQIDEIFSEGYLSSDLKEYVSFIRDENFHYYPPSQGSKPDDILIEYKVRDKKDYFYTYRVSGSGGLQKRQAEQGAAANP